MVILVVEKFFSFLYWCVTQVNRGTFPSVFVTSAEKILILGFRVR